MSMDYSAMLTDAQKRQLVENRLAQFAAEAYQHTLNLKTAEALESETQIENTKKALTTLDAAIKIHQEELAKLPPAELE